MTANVSGRAHVGLGQFAAAKKDLREAWEIAQNFGPGAISAIEAAEAAIALHIALSEVEPEAGHEAKADMYRLALAELQPAQGSGTVHTLH